MVNSIFFELFLRGGSLLQLELQKAGCGDKILSVEFLVITILGMTGDKHILMNCG